MIWHRNIYLQNSAGMTLIEVSAATLIGAIISTAIVFTIVQMFGVYESAVRQYVTLSASADIYTTLNRLCDIASSVTQEINANAVGTHVIGLTVTQTTWDGNQSRVARVIPSSCKLNAELSRILQSQPSAVIDVGILPYGTQGDWTLVAYLQPANGAELGSSVPADALPLYTGPANLENSTFQVGLGSPLQTSRQTFTAYLSIAVGHGVAGTAEDNQATHIPYQFILPE